MRFSSTALSFPCVLLAGVIFVACGSSAKKTDCQNECSTAGATTCDGEKVRTCVKNADGCFKLEAATNCPGGETCQGNACACAVTCGGTCCNAGAACIDGACCDTPCGDTCGCEEPQVCATDGDGHKACGFPCSTSGSCANSAPAGMTCCTVQSDGTGACLPPPSDAAAHVCKCNIISDCDVGQACTPDSPLGVGGPYVCAPLDGSPGGGCNGGNVCSGGYECWQDNRGNAFCTNPCDADGDCPTGSCCIKDPNATFSMAGAATKSGGCMRCP